MEIRPSTSRRILVTLAILLVFTAFLMIGLNALNQESLFGVPLPTGAAKYAEGYEAARAKYQRLCPAIGQEQKGFKGTIVSINANTLVIRSEQLDSDPSSNLKDIRRLTITNETKIEIRTRKPMDQVLEEARNIKPGEMPPLPYTAVTSTLKDFSSNDEVNVLVQQDARTNGDLTAISISKYTN